MKSALTICAVAATLLVTGCASNTQQKVSVNRVQADVAMDAGHQEFRKLIDNAERRRLSAQDVPRPFIAGETKPLSRDITMPEQLRRSVPVTALFQRAPIDLETALRQLSDSSGVLLTATPDALISAAAFGPRTGNAVSPVQAPPRVVLQAQNSPLWSVLDDLARQAHVSWRPVTGGAEFFRVETRVFQLAGLPQVANTSASLGRNGGNNEVFESQSKTSFETKDQNVINGIKTAVEAMLSAGGKATISPENQTLIVTDTPRAMEVISAFVTEQNKILSRRVRVVLEAIEVIDRDGTDVGVDWSLLYSVANGALTMASPGTLASAQAGSIGTSVAVGRFAGTSTVVRALNEVGVVVNRRVFPFLTTSGRPVTQAIRSTFNYVDQVQATSVASSATITQAPTVTQKDETVGTFVTLVPTAKSDGTIFLSLSFDQTTAQPLVPFTVGSADSSVTVQQKTIDGTGVIQEIPIRSGQSVVVGGIETFTSQNTIRRLLPGAPMITGGGDSAKVTKSRLLLVVTAVVEEGV